MAEQNLMIQVSVRPESHELAVSAHKLSDVRVRSFPAQTIENEGITVKTPGQALPCSRTHLRAVLANSSLHTAGTRCLSSEETSQKSWCGNEFDKLHVFGLANCNDVGV